MASRTHHRDELEERELQLAREIQQLDQQHYFSKGKLRTEPAADERRVLQLKPSTNCNSGYSSRNFKVSELKVQQQGQPNRPAMNKKPVKHQFSSMIMGKTVAAMPDKENRPSNLMPNKSGGVKPPPIDQLMKKEMVSSVNAARPPINKHTAKHEQTDKLCRNLMKEFQPEHLFEPEAINSNRLFEDDSLLLDYDSLEFEIKEEDPNSQGSGQLTSEIRKHTQSTSGKMTKRGHATLGGRTEQELQCTFKPVILPKSKQIAQKLRPSFDRLTAYDKKSIQQKPGYRQNNHSVKRYSRQRINTLSQPRQQPQQQCHTQREEEKCSFRPVLSKKSLKQFNHCDMNVVDRNELWLQQKEDKINKLRDEEERTKAAREEADSQRLNTFASKKTPSEMELSKFMKEGLASYFQRLQLASELKRRAEQAEQKYTGRGWNGVTTKTQQFRLGCADRSRSRPKTPNKSGQKQYQRAIKQLHQKIQKLQL